MRKYYEKIYRQSKAGFLKEIEQDITENRRRCIVTANPEIFMLAERMRDVDALMMSEETRIVADGIGIVFGGKVLHCEIEERIPGVEICSDLLVWANRTRHSLFLFGAKPKVVQALSDRVKREYPGIRLVGYENGYVQEKDRVFDRMKELQPDIILVALGAPLQEQLIQKHMHEFEKGLFIGVGGSFDVLSGMKKRAPEFFVKYNLEWLYRITTEPKRLKRFWDNNIKFLFALRKERHG